MDDFDSATYSIESEPGRKQASLDDVILPTVRRSAIQIVSLSPRRQAKRPGPLTTAGADSSTMQVTKLVLKTPPGSPKRQPKIPGVIIKSIQTLAGPGLTGSSSVLTEKRNIPIPTTASDDPVASYRITPILSPQSKDIKKEFEVWRTERERAANEFQDFLRESFKENKTPPSTPPPPPPSAIEVTRIAEKVSSDADSTTVSVIQLKSASKTGTQRVERLNTAKDEVKTVGETKHAAQEAQYVPATQQPIVARRSLLTDTPKQADNVQPSNELIVTESINKPAGDIIDSSIIMPPPKIAHRESHATVETTKPPPANQVCLKPPAKHASSNTKTAVVEDAKKKEKSYDPAKAREFMKEQQAKRRLEKKDVPGGTGSNSKANVEKDLIKQRLETLRQSSQKLVTKNLQKVRKRSLSCAPKEGANLYKRPPTGKDKDAASVR
uniref:Uncharacterized protein n=1 Tax=Anopheles maculatus TaxID=74869 RepID=A0A182SGZ5_9DIPT